MTDPGPDADLEHRIGALWEHNRHQDAYIRDLQTWRASTSAVSTWLRQAIPLAVSVVAIALTTIDLILKFRH